MSCCNNYNLKIKPVTPYEIARDMMFSYDKYLEACNKDAGFTTIETKGIFFKKAYFECVIGENAERFRITIEKV